MTARQPLFMLFVAALALGWATRVAAGPSEQCEAAKLKASGKKAECLLDAEADSVKDGGLPKTAKCVANFETAFAAAETRWGQACPTLGDVNEVEALVDFCRDEVAAALSGSPAPTCAQFPATGQTTSFRAGDDGDIEAGAALSYTDNLDGTITDNNTKLIWEKKSDDEAVNDNDNTTTFPHDKDNVYTWDQAFQHVADLNTDNFANHNDWRLPNVKELQSIVNYGTFNPAVSLAFNTNCVAGVDVESGSCTAASIYWSSTTLADGPGNAWGVLFFNGFVGNAGKDNFLHVRAVRGGSL
ncbi:MAG: Lcl C-terminal domain-containing protein [Gammaproteobacteria bacterium]